MTDDGKAPYFVWGYSGLTPVMKSIVYDESARFKAFLKHAPREQIKKQMPSLFILARCRMEKKYHEMLLRY